MAKKKKTAAKTAQKSRPRFTTKQGQYLAYLHRKLHGCSPSEIEIAKHFRVSPPTVHQMIVKLDEED